MITRFGTLTQADGINVFIWQLSETLSNAGHEVYVVGTSGTGDESGAVTRIFGIDPSRIQIRSLMRHERFKNTMFQVSLWATKGSEVVNGIKPDAIIVNGAIPLATRINRVVVSHDLENRYRFQSGYLSMIYKSYPAIIATTNELKRKLVSAYDFKEDKIRVIPVGIGLEKYSSLPYERRRRAVLHIGTRRSKNLATTIKIFGELSRLDPTVELEIVGPESSYLRDCLSTLGDSVRGRVKYLGLLSGSDYRKTLASAMLTIVPSSYRVPVISPTVLESLASGTPVLGSDGISEDLLIDGYNGLRYRQEERVEQKLFSLINDEDAWGRISGNALKHVQNFDIRKVSQMYENSLEEL